MKTALLAGGTGLTGSQLLHLLLENPDYEKVIALSRSDLAPHPKLLHRRADFEKLDEQLDDISPDDVFCCLGTTIAKARSKEEFYRVDFNFPYLLAKAAKARGARQYLLMSSLGANKTSSFYYNQVKGQLEEAVCGFAFQAVHIFRPSLLLGPRLEKRSGEQAAKLFYKVFGFMIPKTYKAIDSGKVAHAMMHFATQNKSGIFIHESGELQNF